MRWIDIRFIKTVRLKTWFLFLFFAAQFLLDSFFFWKTRKEKFTKRKQKRVREMMQF